MEKRDKIKILRSAVGSMPSWGLIEELQSHDIEVIGMDSSPLSFGLYKLEKSYVVPKGNDPKFIESILEIIDKEKPDAILTGPEQEILSLSENKKRIEEKGTMVLCPDYEYAKICADKKETDKAFKKIGIPTPEIYENQDTAKFPCIIKPRFGAGSSNIYVAKNKKDLISHLSKVENPIIQEFIEGQEYTIDTLVDKDNNVLAVVPRKRLFTESGISVKGETVYDKEMISYCTKIAKELHLFGPSCIQCIKNNKDIKFIEINSRFGGGAIIAIKSDPTIIPNLLRIIRGEQTIPSKGFKQGLTMLRYYSEVFIDKGDLKK